MKNSFRTLAVAGIVLLSSFAFVMNSWQIPATSKVSFSIDGLLGIDVNGTLNFKSSEIRFDPSNPAASGMNVVLDVASVNTNSKKRDNHLKTADFFDAAKYPDISFQSTTFQKMTNGSYSVTGNLKIKEITKVVAIPFTFAETSAGGVFKGKFTINRMDYKVGENEKHGVGDEVRISLEVPVTKK